MGLVLLDSRKNESEAYRIIKNSPDKFQAMSKFTFAHAFNDNLYQAQLQIPEFISSSDLASFFKNMINGSNASSVGHKEWRRFNEGELFVARRYLPYINEDE